MSEPPVVYGRHLKVVKKEFKATFRLRKGGPTRNSFIIELESNPRGDLYLDLEVGVPDRIVLERVKGKLKKEGG